MSATSDEDGSNSSGTGPSIDCDESSGDDGGGGERGGGGGGGGNSSDETVPGWGTALFGWGNASKKSEEKGGGGREATEKQVDEDASEQGECGGGAV